MSASLRRMLAIVATFMLFAAACGGSDSSDEASSSDSGSESSESSSSESASASESSSSSSEESSSSSSEASESSSSGSAESSSSGSASEVASGDCSGTYTFESYSGEVEVPRNPENIAVFDLGMLTSLETLGVPLDGADGFASLGTPLPADVEEIVAIPQSLGTVWEPDLEALNAMEPDLIVLASRSSRFYPDFVDLGIAPVVDLTSFDDWLPPPGGTEGEVDFFEEFARTHRHIGEIFCVQDEVEAVISDLEGSIDQINAVAAESGDALVLVTTGAEVTAFGPGAFRFGQIYDVWGFSSADESLARDETHGEPVSYEFIAEAEPEVLFVVDRAAATGDEGEGAQAILDNALVNATPAAQNGQIFYVDSFDWYIVFNGILGLQGVAEDLSAVTGAAASSSSSSSDESAAGTEYPLTVDHKFGSTTIDAEPERVVSVGYNEHDFLLALGVVPVGLRDWYGEQPNSVWPWGQDALGDATPGQVAGEDGLDYEAIAAMDPDVIVGIWSGMTEEEYELLSEIAPTVAQPDEYLDYGTPWQEQTLILGEVTDRQAEAEAAVASIDAKIAAAREANPGWADLTAAVAFRFEDNPGAYNSEDPRSRLLTDLGFQIPPEFDEAAGDAFFFESSAETLPEDIDVDIIVWVAGSEEDYEDLVAALPTRIGLRAYQNGGELFASTELTGAFSHSSPLSLDFAIDQLVAELEIAADGDPSTVVPSAEEFGTVVGG
ncbi:MAG: ABC transporter substrate-binding protein [Actinomycetota bacterium]